MASRSRMLSEEQFQCSICLDVFTDPISVTCGYDFCEACIKGHWDDNSSCQCPLCKETSTRRPEEVKTEQKIQGVSRDLKETQKGSVDKFVAEHVTCDICTWSKLKAVKFCLECFTSLCEIHLEPHHQVAGLKRHTLLDPEVTLENKTCKKHNALLDMFCRTDEECVCQTCISEGHGGHDAVRLEDESDEVKALLGDTEVRVRQMIQEKLEKVQEVRHLVELSRRQAQRDICESVQVFSALILSLEKSQTELIRVIKKKHRATERRAEAFTRDLEAEISSLQIRCTELTQLSQANDHFLVFLRSSSITSLPHAEDQQDFSIESSFYEQNIRKHLQSSVEDLQETARQELSDLEEKFNRTKEKFQDQDLERIRHYAVDVTLDPNSAHCFLIISDDGKEVKEGKWQNRPLKPERFTGLLGSSVVAKEGYDSGKFYFEVRVEGKNKWAIGVARESVDRKKWFPTSPEHGYWTMALGDGYKANTAPPVILHLRNLKKVGVFVEYEEGHVSFYDTEAKTHIYSFTGYTFTEKLYPYLHCGVNDSAPLVLTPVNLEDKTLTNPTPQQNQR